MIVSFYDPSQFDALADAFEDMGRHYFGPAAPDRATLRQTLADEILGEHSGVTLVVAMAQARVAGFATVSILYPAPGYKGQLFMKDLYTCAAWRGHGVGEAIMRFLARHALRTGCVRFDWTTENTNAGAIAFYERLGARQVPEKIYFRLTLPEIEALAVQPPGAGAPTPEPLGSGQTAPNPRNTG